MEILRLRSLPVSFPCGGRLERSERSETIANIWSNVDDVGYSRDMPMNRRCDHMTAGHEATDLGALIRCVDCGARIGHIYDDGEVSGPLHVIYNARYCGGDLVEGTVIDMREKV